MITGVTAVVLSINIDNNSYNNSHSSHTVYCQPRKWSSLIVTILEIMNDEAVINNVPSNPYKHHWRLELYFISDNIVLRLISWDQVLIINQWSPLFIQDTSHQSRQHPLSTSLSLNNTSDSNSSNDWTCNISNQNIFRTTIC